MKIVDRKTFLSLPVGTVFRKYRPCYFGELEVKSETMGVDFYARDVAGGLPFDSTEAFMMMCDQCTAGEDIPLEFESEMRDGLFEEDQLFAVYSTEDVRALADSIRALLP